MAGYALCKHGAAQFRTFDDISCTPDLIVGGESDNGDRWRHDQVECRHVGAQEMAAATLWPVREDAGNAGGLEGLLGCGQGTRVACQKCCILNTISHVEATKQMVDNIMVLGGAGTEGISKGHSVGPNSMFTAQREHQEPGIPQG